MKNESLNRLAWMKLLSNRSYLLSLFVIVFCFFTSFCSYLFIPDKTPYANQMYLELATLPPLSETQFLVTPKNFRKKINKIDLNYIYNFDQKVILLQDIKVDGKFNKSVNKTMNNISIRDNILQNKIYLKNLLNEVLKSYSG